MDYAWLIDDIETLSTYTKDGYTKAVLKRAADVIEQLVSAVPKWIHVKSRPMTDEERQDWSEKIGYDPTTDDGMIFCSPLPDDGQEVLVCNIYGSIWLDTFSDDPDYGCGFEGNGDMDGIVAWMPLPEPPKEETE